MASIRNSFPMDGSAILIEDMAKGERKAANVVINRANLLLTALSTLIASVIVNLNRMVKPNLHGLTNQPYIARLRTLGTLGDFKFNLAAPSPDKPRNV